MLRLVKAACAQRQREGRHDGGHRPGPEAHPRQAIDYRFRNMRDGHREQEERATEADPAQASFLWLTNVCGQQSSVQIRSYTWALTGKFQPQLAALAEALSLIVTLLPAVETELIERVTT